MALSVANSWYDRIDPRSAVLRKMAGVGAFDRPMRELLILAIPSPPGQGDVGFFTVRAECAETCMLGSWPRYRLGIDGGLETSNSSPP